MALYSDVLTEMYGEDKAEAMRYIEDDFQFDAWLKRYSAKMAKAHNSTGRAGKHAVTKKQFASRTAGMLPQPGT